MIQFSAIVFAMAIFFSFMSTRNFLFELVCRKDVGFAGTTGQLLIACLLWGLFYFLTH